MFQGPVGVFFRRTVHLSDFPVDLVGMRHAVKLNFPYLAKQANRL